MLGEDEPLVVRVERIFEHLAQLLELGLVSGRDERAGAVPETPEGFHLRAQLLDPDRGDRAEDRILEVLAALAGLTRLAGLGAAFARVLVGAVGLEEVLPVSRGQGLLAAPEEGRVEAAGPPVVDVALQLPDPALEGTEQGRGRARKPALEHAHRELRRGLVPVAERPSVVLAEVVGGAEVERVLAVLAAGEVEAERAALPRPVERGALKVHHLLLRAADEVALPLPGRAAAQGLRGSEGVMVEEPPEVEVRRLLAHVGGRGQEEEMPRRPGEAGKPAVVAGAGGGVRDRGGAVRRGAVRCGAVRHAAVRHAAVRRGAGQRLGEAVAAGPGDPGPGARGGQLVGLVEHHQVVRGDLGGAEGRERALGREGVEGDDDLIAARPGEGVRAAPPCVRPGHDAALQPEEGAELALPVADEAGRRDDQHPADAAAEQHLPHVEAGHDGLAGAGVVGEQEAQRILLQHPLIDRDALVGERIDPGGLAREGGVELVPVGQPVRLRHEQDRRRVPGEVEGRGRRRRPARRRVRVGAGAPRRDRLLHLPQPVERQGAGPGLPRLPAMDGERSDRHPLREVGLGQAHPRTSGAHPLGKAVKGLATVVHGAHPTRAPGRLSIWIFHEQKEAYQLIIHRLISCRF